jgi:ubiquinone/menaquinone biosynthesis C-methylase UbiE
MKINLGSGSKLLDGYVNVDYYNPDAEVKHNLDVMPYPFADQSVSHVVMDNSLEHLTDVIAVMKELHRITAPGGEITIIVPYFRSVWAHVDPTHKHCFTVDTLSYFDVDHPYHQRYKFCLNAKFRIRERKFNKNIDKSWFRHLVLIWANRYPNAYETYFSHFYPMEDLTIVLERI